MSLVQRVMSEAVEKESTCEADRRMTLEYTRERRSRAILAPVREARRLTSTLPTMDSAAMPSIMRPTRLR